MNKIDDERIDAIARVINGINRPRHAAKKSKHSHKTVVVLEKIIKNYAAEIEALKEETLVGAILQGKGFYDKVKNVYASRSTKRAICTDNESMIHFVNCLGFKMRISGKVEPMDITKKRLFAILHNIAYVRGYKVVSPLLAGVTMPKALDNITSLIGTGLAFNGYKIQNQAWLLAAGLILDYVIFRNKVKDITKKRAITQESFIGENWRTMQTTKAIMGRMGANSKAVSTNVIRNAVELYLNTKVSDLRGIDIRLATFFDW